MSVCFIAQEIAGACLYLAGKSEENSVKARDIVNTSYCVLNPEAPLIPINQDYSDRKERIVDLEQIVLRSLHFDVEFEQPHLHMFAYAMSLKVSKALVQCAAAILLDGMCLPRISKMSCSMQACGSLHLASQFLNEPIQSGTKVPWYLPFDVSYSSIDDYCNALLDLYESFPELVQIVLSQ
eukprot:TRINITY_DN9556_c0_g2_i2.p1 TRINITY_DN9556_c0_g2~~TRINITY_DN9556_c0_g2_i2.p1  ORF type:complete len:181 (+),score=25.64 TRINITY_DN9556_c0_g2_i2:59-601(+)